MSIQKRLLLAVFVASQLPAHLIAGPLPIRGGAHTDGAACIGGDFNTGCEAWPARVASSHVPRNQPQGHWKGNNSDFNGYAVVGPSKAVTKLNDAIRTNKNDVKVVKFDEEVEDPANPGKKFTRYQKPLITPRSGTNGAPTYNVPSVVVHTQDDEFQDPDVGLPVKRMKPNRSEDPGALYQSIEIRSTKNKEGKFDPLNKDDVVAMGANKDGTVIVVEVTDAREDFNKAAGDRVPDDLKKSPPSDLIFAGAAQARDPSKPASNLSVIMQRAATNKGVINTLREAYKRNGLSNTKKAVFRASAAKDTSEGQAFDALMKTKTFEVANFLLADHHQAIGDKIIQKIVVFPDKTFPDTTDKNAKADIYLILGKQ